MRDSSGWRGSWGRPVACRNPPWQDGAVRFRGPVVPQGVRRVEHRMSRKVVLGREETPYTAVLHEPVLRTRVADRSVARTQLDSLLALSENHDVTLRVIPFDVDGFAGASAELIYAGGRVPALDTAQRDTTYGPAFMDAPAQLKAMRVLFRRVAGVSLDPAPSRDYIHRLAKEL
ncbi:Scr1 family TA system antitoxin-like transcriptional regulator [Streptomyces europaeiscabiei]|uniref:Scr1 family TA system antitoxin-like transcriptional regulator n=1 Tax=Streptomyces europaeiscabiei TaxID=146819 RepID=UPI0029AAE243|nr:Scr1 family TA system antitoxin-like transcriptional regulator [Streptomyces europaeiscabiei]MDX2764212.1 Scr1 family TA system antitoxin-like transcriptional regulator [Streptomyces europaeiscabiei]